MIGREERRLEKRKAKKARTESALYATNLQGSNTHDDWEFFFICFIVLFICFIVSFICFIASLYSFIVLFKCFIVSDLLVLCLYQTATMQKSCYTVVMAAIKAQPQSHPPASSCTETAALLLKERSAWHCCHETPPCLGCSDPRGMQAGGACSRVHAPVQCN